MKEALLYERLEGVPTRLLTAAELERAAAARLDTALRTALDDLTTAVDRRDALLFSRTATDEQRTDADTRVEDARMLVTRLREAIPTDYAGPTERAIEFDQLNVDGRVLDPLDEVPAQRTTELEQVASARNLDLVIFGSVEEIVGYIAVDIYAYNRLLDEVSLVGGTVGLPQEVGDDAHVIADDLAADLLGREWSAVAVMTANADSEVVVDGALAGYGDVLVPYLTVGRHTVTVSAEGYETFQTTVVTESMQTETVRVGLVPATGRVVRLESSPAGATVYIDSIYAGTTPMTWNFTRLPALVRIEHDGYLESRFVIDTDSPDTVARALLRDTVDWTVGIEQRRSTFYRSLAWFAVSIPVTLALRGGYLNVYGAFPPSDDGSLTPEARQDFARLGNILYWSSLAGMMVNIGLLANTILDIRDYIQVGQGSHNQ